MFLKRKIAKLMYTFNIKLAKNVRIWRKLTFDGKIQVYIRATLTSCNSRAFSPPFSILLRYFSSLHQKSISTEVFFTFRRIDISKLLNITFPRCPLFRFPTVYKCKYSLISSNIRDYIGS